MISAINILISPKRTFVELYEEFDHSLNARTNFIFILAGILNELEDVLSDPLLRQQELGYKFVTVGLVGAISLVFGRYIFTYTLFFIGRLMKGKASVVDVRVAVGYSMIPIIFMFPILLLIGLNDRYAEMSEIGTLSLNILKIIIGLFSLFIMTTGLKLYNKYSLLKAISNALISIIALATIFGAILYGAYQSAMS